MARAHHVIEITSSDMITRRYLAANEHTTVPVMFESEGTAASRARSASKQYPEAHPVPVKANGQIVGWAVQV